MKFRKSFRKALSLVGDVLMNTRNKPNSKEVKK